MNQLRSMQRRGLLKVVGAFFLCHPFGLTKALASSGTTALEYKTLAAFLDVLLPHDDLSGSATELRIDEKLWELSEFDNRFRHLVLLGCRWLNLTGGPPFVELNMEQQVAVVEWMSNSDWDQVPRRFYELVRQTAIELYYSDPAAWTGLPLERPPQPQGYPPPWQ